MASKEVHHGGFHVTVHQEGKERWADLPACRLENDCELVDLQELLAIILPFLDGDGTFEDLPGVV